MILEKRNRIKVIYIMGYGRSGSTFMDILLGNHKDFISVGALSNFFDWEINDGICACHQSFNNCQFWKKVKEGFYHLIEYQNPEECAVVQKRVENRWNLFSLLLDRIACSNK